MKTAALILQESRFLRYRRFSSLRPAAVAGLMFLSHPGLAQFVCSTVETSGFKTCGGDFIYAL
jgi:hypothetical protein